MAVNRIMCTSKLLTDLCFTKQIIKTNKYFCKSCLQCFRIEHVLTKVCLNLNGAQSVRIKKEQLSLKIVSNKYQFHSKFMLILSVKEKLRSRSV